MPVWVLSVIQISFIFLGIPQPSPLLCTPSFCRIYQDFTIKSLMIHKVIPAAGLLFWSISRMPLQGHIKIWIKIWLPFVQHSLSQEPNKVEALLSLFFKWGNQGLASLGPDQTQAITPKNQTLIHQVILFPNFVDFCFIFLIHCPLSWKLTSLLLYSVYSGSARSTCVLGKYCVLECQVCERYNMLFLSHVLTSSASLMLF